MNGRMPTNIGSLAAEERTDTVLISVISFGGGHFPSRDIEQVDVEGMKGKK